MGGKFLARLLEAVNSKKQERNWSKTSEIRVPSGVLELTDFCSTPVGDIKRVKKANNKATKVTNLLYI